MATPSSMIDNEFQKRSAFINLREPSREGDITNDAPMCDGNVCSAMMKRTANASYAPPPARPMMPDVEYDRHNNRACERGTVFDHSECSLWEKNRLRHSEQSAALFLRDSLQTCPETKARRQEEEEMAEDDKAYAVKPKGTNGVW